MTARHALPATCPRCSALTLATTWDPIEHMPLPAPVHTDPTALTRELETACIILDRPTYGHYLHARGPQLARRDAHWHRWRHLGQPDHILPAHRCGTHLPGTPIPHQQPTPPADPNQLALELTPEPAPPF